VAGAAASGFLRRKKLTIVGTIAQNGAHVSTAPSAGPMSRHRDSGRPGAVRIIGGRWRGTRLAVADAPGLRPTSDRARETLFNWLQPKLPGARVLDLFAGSGALGLEALSRGAREALLVERDPRLVESLRDVVARLQAGGQAQVVRADALAWLDAPLHGRFDLVFLDPPFDAGLWPEVLARLPPWLSAEAWLYVEMPLAAAVPPGPEWLPHREGSTREVRYALYRRARRAAAAAATLVPDPNADGAATE
jgi:16S rRNA (guanine966-N2)-methyltransferase